MDHSIRENYIFLMILMFPFGSLANEGDAANLLI